MQRLGKQSFTFENVYIDSFASGAGRKEREGFFGSYYDFVIPDMLFGEKSFEAAERRLFTETVKRVVVKSGKMIKDIDLLIGGDLLNQIISSAYTARDLKLPFLGVYGACSTMSEAMLLASMAVEGGYANTAVCGTASHFGAAERQFRYPLELGTPRTPSSQCTATASGALVVTGEKKRVRISGASIGVPIDFGITDANNMGAAMAPAAASTICTHLEDMGVEPEYYDLIITGDLGTFGSELLLDMCKKCGKDIKKVHKDCGAMIYSGLPNSYSGGSGCGCGASSLAAYFLPEVQKRNIKRLLFVATGALHSPTAVQQGESIPGIAHAVSVEAVEEYMPEITEDLYINMF